MFQILRLLNIGDIIRKMLIGGMFMLSVYICDDSRHFAEELRSRINSIDMASKYRASIITTADKLRAMLAGGKRPDILFMDVEFGEVNGIEVARELLAGEKTQIVFITNYVDYCSDVYEAEHAYFIRKPVTDEHLSRALEICCRRLERADDKVCFKLKNGMVCFNRHDILFFVSNYRKITVHADSGLTEFYSTISDIKEIIGERFIQCHKSFLVNLDRVSTMERDKFILDSGERIPISRSMSEAVREAFFKYLRKE
jgi:DNA-binding LytR/AlgR family response regulator